MSLIFRPMHSGFQGLNNLTCLSDTSLSIVSFRPYLVKGRGPVKNRHLLVLDNVPLVLDEVEGEVATDCVTGNASYHLEYG